MFDFIRRWFTPVPNPPVERMVITQDDLKRSFENLVHMNCFSRDCFPRPAPQRLIDSMRSFGCRESLLAALQRERDYADGKGCVK